MSIVLSRKDTAIEINRVLLEAIDFVLRKDEYKIIEGKLVTPTRSNADHKLVQELANARHALNEYRLVNGESIEDIEDSELD